MTTVDKKGLKIGEDYLLFISYDYSPSGFDIANYSHGGYFTTQGNETEFKIEDVKVYYLPYVD